MVRVLDSGVRVGVVELELQPGAGAYGVLRECKSDALTVGVVLLNLVTGSRANLFANKRVRRLVGTQVIRPLPVSCVFRSVVYRVVSGVYVGVSLLTQRNVFFLRRED